MTVVSIFKTAELTQTCCSVTYYKTYFSFEAHLAMDPFLRFDLDSLNNNKVYWRNTCIIHTAYDDSPQIDMQ